MSVFQWCGTLLIFFLCLWSSWSICEWGFKISQYKCIGIYLSFMFSSFCSTKLNVLTWYTYIYDCYLFLLFSLLKCIDLLSDQFWPEVHFFWALYSYFFLVFGLQLYGILFSILWFLPSGGFEFLPRWSACQSWAFSSAVIELLLLLTLLLLEVIWWASPVTCLPKVGFLFSPI